jgi:hypothetical protein
LLSQWRAYGREGGYAVVFDTRRLSQLLKTEGEKWGHALFGGDVIYSSATDAALREELGSNIDQIGACLAQWLATGGRDDTLEPIYDNLVICACRYKHWGFYEEREVRVIVIPPNSELFAEQKARGLVALEKPRHHFSRASIAVPCIHLFEGITALAGEQIPISRIIVGPHRDKDRRQRAVKALVAECHLEIPVTISEIPYADHF